MFKIFKEMKIQQPKSVKMVGEPGLPAHESKLRSLREDEINGKLVVKVTAFINSIKERTQ